MYNNTIRSLSDSERNYKTTLEKGDRGSSFKLIVHFDFNSGPSVWRTELIGIPTDYRQLSNADARVVMLNNQSRMIEPPSF